MQNPKVKYITVNVAFAGQRIDNFLLRELKGVPKSRIYKLLRSGELRVNKKRTKPDYRLQEEDVVRIPPIRMSEELKPRADQEILQELEKRIIFENDQLIVINKPSGLPVHSGSGFGYGVIEAMRLLLPKFPQLELAHRLDKGTSGCLVLAKKRSALQQLHQAFLNDQVDKYYLTLTAGHWAKHERYVNLPLRRYTLSSGERKVVVDEQQGKVAQSWFKLLKKFAQAELVEVKIETGRTHQIRVHAQAMNHPVAGDDKYGDKAFNAQMKALGLKRMFLHAWKIVLNCFDKPITVEAPLDEKLEGVLLGMKEK